MSEKIKLRCPKCEKTTEVDRDPTDPQRAVLAEIQCPECVGGDFDSPIFFAGDGSEVPFYEDDLEAA